MPDEEGNYARPATIDDLKAVIRALNDNGVDYLLIGGYALYAHGYYRATQPKSYYDSGGDYARADELWNEVIAAMDAEIDFGDGEVAHVPPKDARNRPKSAMPTDPS